MEQTFSETTPVKRVARLFRAGDYPDRDARITVADLDAVVSRFDAERDQNFAPVPVRIEHTETALDPLGEVLEIHRRDAELWGTLSLAPCIAAHLRLTGAKHVSVTLSRQTGEPSYRLAEVSVVRDPVIQDAGFVDGEEYTFAETPVAKPVTNADCAEAERRNFARSSDGRCDALFDRFRRAGKLTPAMETVLRPLLTTDTPEARFAQTHPAGLFDAVTRLLSVMPQTRTMATSGAELIALQIGGDTGSYSPILEKACAGLGVSPRDAERYF